MDKTPEEKLADLADKIAEAFWREHFLPKMLLSVQDGETWEFSHPDLKTESYKFADSILALGAAAGLGWLLMVLGSNWVMDPEMGLESVVEKARYKFVSLKGIEAKK